MKRAFCLLFAVILIFGLVSCKKEKDSTNVDRVDIEYYANLGEIPECEFALGDSVEDIEKTLSERAEESHEVFYNQVEGKNNVLIEDGTHAYYYVKSNKENGVSYIVSYETAYGFEIGDVSIQIKEAISDIEYTEEELNENNSFFLYGEGEGNVLKCKFEKNTVMFVFRENALCATVIYNNKDWE